MYLRRFTLRFFGRDGETPIDHLKLHHNFCAIETVRHYHSWRHFLCIKPLFTYNEKDQIEPKKKILKKTQVRHMPGLIHLPNSNEVMEINNNSFQQVNKKLT